jgi:hypothetical protein
MPLPVVDELGALELPEHLVQLAKLKVVKTSASARLLKPRKDFEVSMFFAP